MLVPLRALVLLRIVEASAICQQKQVPCPSASVYRNFAFPFSHVKKISTFVPETLIQESANRAVCSVIGFKPMACNHCQRHRMKCIPGGSESCIRCKKKGEICERQHSRRRATKSPRTNRVIPPKYESLREDWKKLTREWRKLRRQQWQLKCKMKGLRWIACCFSTSSSVPPLVNNDSVGQQVRDINTTSTL